LALIGSTDRLDQPAKLDRDLGYRGLAASRHARQHGELALYGAETR